MNPIVGRVAEAIDEVDHVLVREEDAALRHIDMVLARIEDVLTDRGANTGHRELDAYDRALAPTLDAKQALNETSYNFFIDTVAQAVSEWDATAWEARKQQYLVDRRLRLDELNGQFEQFLETVPALA